MNLLKVKKGSIKLGIFGKLLGKDQDKNAINSPANNDAKPIANATIANAPSHATEQDLLEYYSAFVSISKLIYMKRLVIMLGMPI